MTREQQRLEDAKLEGMPAPMSAYDIALRGGDCVFERFIAKQEAIRDQEEQDATE